MKKNRILHLSAHLGGGVGRVLLNYFAYDKKNSHSIYCLDYINENAKNILHSLQIENYEIFHKNYKFLNKEIKKADIVVIHWWNHPLLYEFLVKNILPPCRVVLWSHTSGFHAPQIFSKKLFDYGDKFIFTTPVSYLTKEAKAYKKQEKLSHIWSSGGLLHVKEVKKKKHNGFNIGYIGSVDFAKMHPDFVEICSLVDIPNVKFIVCGDGCDLKTIKRQVEKRDLSDKFEFVGHVEDIKKYLEIFDIFGYPLNKKHYGTCDQVIAEAMSSGIVPVVFNNHMESYMVHHLKTGLIAKNKKEYAKHIKLIYKNKNIKKLLETEAKKEALKRYRVEKTVANWNKMYSEIIKVPKTKKQWLKRKNNLHVKPHEIFLESMGKSAKFFNKMDDIELQNFLSLSEAWKSKSNGSILQYIQFLGKDEKLEKWIKLVFNKGRK